MKHRVLWQPEGSLDGAVVDPVYQTGMVDGIFAYSIIASDEKTRLDLHVRVQPGEAARAYDIGLHTYLHNDPEGDRRQSFTSALRGHEFVGRIHEFCEFCTPSLAFWMALESQFLDWDAKARADYRADFDARDENLTGGVEFPTPPNEAKAPLELANAYRITGRNDNVVLIEAADIETAIAKYRALVDRVVAGMASTAAKPLYEISLIDHVGPITIIR